MICARARRHTDAVSTLFSSNAALDLSQLPPPVIIPQPSFESLVSSITAGFVARMAAAGVVYDALVESDPAMKLIEEFAYRIQVQNATFNDAAVGQLLSYAGGAVLNYLGAYYGVQRLTITPANPATNTAAILESDDAFRARIALAPDAFSVAGPEAAYVFFAKTASPDVLDASATSPSPGVVVVTVQSRANDGIASAATLSAVEAVVTSDGLRPEDDDVRVQSVTLAPYSIVAQLWLYPGPDANTILANAQAALNLWLATSTKIGRDVAQSAISAALSVAGVQRVVLQSPGADIPIDDLTVSSCTSIQITVAGNDY